MAKKVCYNKGANHIEKGESCEKENDSSTDGSSDHVRKHNFTSK